MCSSDLLAPGASTWINITDADDALYMNTFASNMLSVPAEGELNGYQYRCVISGVTNQVVSLAATMSVEDPAAPPSKFGNISTRAFVGTGASVEIGGFIVSGTQPKQVLIRGLGPALKQYGVSGALGDPVLKLFSGQTVIATNDNWSSDSSATAAITRVTSLVNAPSFELGSKDAAILTTLSPGGYTVQIGRASCRERV